MANSVISYQSQQAHNLRDVDRDYVQRLQPRVIRLINPDASQVSRMYELSPNSEFHLRNHDISEQKGDMEHEPVGTGKRHARELFEWLVKMRIIADSQHKPFPRWEQIRVPGINEPVMDAGRRQDMEYQDWLRKTKALTGAIDLYTSTLITETRHHTHLSQRPYGLLCINSGVGWPPNLAAGEPAYWGWFPLTKQLVESDPARWRLCCHAYWGKSGPEHNGEWYAYRPLTCDWQIGTEMSIGECGLDNHVEDSPTNSGWGQQVDAGTYAGQIDDFLGHYQGTAHDACLFVSDPGYPWKSLGFDPEPVYDRLLAIDESFVPVQPPPPQPPPPQPPVPPPGTGARSQYMAWFRDYGAAYDIPWYILAALAYNESAYDPRAVSSAGAQGLMQFMPATWAEWGHGDPFDPEASIAAAAAYLNWIRNYLDSGKTWFPILAGYNWGPGRVKEKGWQAAPPETKNYIHNIVVGSEMLRRWEDGIE